MSNTLLQEIYYLSTKNMLSPEIVQEPFSFKNNPGG